jgi:hypothetical protein
MRYIVAVCVTLAIVVAVNLYMVSRAVEGDLQISPSYEQERR